MADAFLNRTGLQNTARKNAKETGFGFRVGELGFVLPIDLHCEIIEQPVVNAMPKVDAWFNGLLNNRGHIVPVFDLRILLDGAASDSQNRYLFAIGRNEKTMALWIDGYPQLLTDLEQTLASLPALPERLQPFVTTAYWQDDQVWLEAQFEQLFSSLGRQPSRMETAP